MSLSQEFRWNNNVYYFNAFAKSTVTSPDDALSDEWSEVQWFVLKKQCLVYQVRYARTGKLYSYNTIVLAVNVTPF